MSRIVIFLCAVIAVGVAEKPGPYPAKGWKPQGARLELPREYGTPRPEEIEFTTQTNEYLPPTTTEITSEDEDEAALRVQGLPEIKSTSSFRNFQKRRLTNVRARPQLGRIQMAPAPAFANQPFLLASLFAPQFAPASQQLRERQFGQSAEVNDPKNDAQQLPARAYGPPKDEVERENVEPELPENDQPENEEPQSEEQPEDERQPQNEEEQPQNDTENDEDDEEGSVPTIAVANAESNGNLVQGQYYLLLPDQSLQKVRFATKQTDEDRQINGFSAQLR